MNDEVLRRFFKVNYYGTALLLWGVLSGWVTDGGEDLFSNLKRLFVLEMGLVRFGKLEA